MKTSLEHLPAHKRDQITAIAALIRQDSPAEARGQARALVEVLRRRGVSMSDAEAGRILACRDESLLARWWDRALTVSSAAELLDDTQS
jgi:hypothetical protein